MSEGGILLETYAPIDPQNILSFSVGMEDETMDVKGRVIFNKKRDDEMFESGIEFIETDESKRRILKQFAIMYKNDVRE